MVVDLIIFLTDVLSCRDDRAIVVEEELETVHRVYAPSSEYKFDLRPYTATPL